MRLYIHYRDLLPSGKGFVTAALLWGLTSGLGAAAQSRSTIFYTQTPPATACANGTMEHSGPSPALLRTCETALENDRLAPDVRAATLVNTGILEMRAGDAEEALRLFALARQTDEALPDIRTNIAAAQIRAGRPDAALETLSAIETVTEGQRHIAYFNRGLAHWHLKAYPAAHADFTAAHELAPGYRPARNMLDQFIVTPARQTASETVDSEG